MPIQSGTRLGAYEVIEPIAAGGMGEVYRARDLRLERDVAIKVIREQSSSDPDAVARFGREARAASALNHPHILTIYDVGQVEIPGESGPRNFMAMELVVGQTLREHAPRDAVASLIEYFIQVGEALAKAHEANIIHRDLKPDNIMITADGYAKVLDFGLAKLVAGKAPISTLAPTAVAASDSGVIAGTLTYMSPEQIRGERCDQRSDIFSFGVVMYEAVTGRHAFRAETFAEAVHQITSVNPAPMRTLNASTPPELQRIVQRCLAKDPQNRYPSMREAVADLRAARDRLRDGGARKLPRLTQLTFAKAIEHFPAVAPEGTRLVFSREVGKVRKLFLMRLDDSSEIQLTRGEHDDIQPAWSPDAATVLFVRGNDAGARLEPGDVFGSYFGGNIWAIDVESGHEQRLIADAYNPSFSPDGTRIAFDCSWSGPRRLWTADARGRNPQQVTTDASEAPAHVRPRWSPDGSKLVFQNIEGTKFDVRIVDLASRRMEWVTNDFVQDIHPVWSSEGDAIFLSSYRGGGINVWRIPVDLDGAPAGPLEQITAGSGHDVDIDVPRDGGRVVFATLKQNADIWKLPVDPATGAVTGAPEEVVSTTRENSRGAWSPDGERVAFNSDRGGDMNLWLLTVRDGRTRQLTRGAGGDFQPSWSPDGKSLAFFSGRGGAVDIWRYDFEGEVLTRLTDGNGININPFFSPDGSRIAYQSDRDGRMEICVINSDGSGARQLTTIGSGGHFARWSPDGKHIYFRCPAPPSPGVRMVPVDGGEPVALPTLVGGSHISFSPDHTAMMDVVGHRTLWLSPLDGTPPRKIFEFEDSDSRIDYPVWSPDGRWILFDRFVPRGGDVWMVEGL